MQPLPPPVWLSWLKETIRTPAVFGVVCGTAAGLISAGFQFEYRVVIALAVGWVATEIAHILWPN